ncbi:ATP-binding cassette domain-containing protein [Sphaerisporangium perillae]|uniref:ATP-binding cassette domain-containing protein n=1 Tax=Sphaerisporangium perillae TaxID=2935860 RepID=UPI00200E7857|nr:ATP-binding cassette domain-containing protein [Sphaerisporangium perillae]
MADPEAPAIEAEGLRKRYGKTVALDGVDLTIKSGTICGVLGPNGAGKTTVIRILTTLLRPDGGTARVDGYDTVRQAELVRYRIGLAGQYAAVDELLTGRGNLEMIGRLCHLPRKEAQRRADELLHRFGLTEAAERLAKTYSGGMRRRLDLAASLTVEPPILFLDEPTTGLDPRSRAGMWTLIADLVEAGTTVLLTTQYLEEADRLADQIVVIDAGKVLATGSPTELKATTGGEHLDVVVHRDDEIETARAAMTRVASARPRVERHLRRITVPVTSGPAALIEAVRELDARSVAIDDISLRRPTLDDVFLRLTGRLADADQSDATTADDDRLTSQGAAQ